MPIGQRHTVVSLYLSRKEKKFLARVAKMRGQSLNRFLLQMTRESVLRHNDEGTLLAPKKEAPK
jgi:uncharacterized protein (DUF1778 family)